MQSVQYSKVNQIQDCIQLQEYRLIIRDDLLLDYMSKVLAKRAVVQIYQDVY